jgi:K+-transporting ATPase ATPase B chain
LSAIGIAGMDRLIQANVIATSGRAVEAAGDVDVLLLDKTGTITLGNRQATAFSRARASTSKRSSPTPRSSRRSPTRRPRAAASSCSPRSVHGLRGRATSRELGASFVPFTAQTRMSGVDLRRAHDPQGRRRRDRALRRRARGSVRPTEVRARSTTWRAAARRRWSWPRRAVLGVVQLKDIVKGGIRERFAELRAWASRP